LRKQPSYSRLPLHHREMAQHHAGRAAALLDAGRTFLHSAIAEAYAEAERSPHLSEATKIRCQLAACFGAESCARAVDLVHEVAGTSAIRLEHPFERHHRDVHVLTQHATKSSARYADVGKMLFGMPPDFFNLEL
jgi:alkylation response protein AidB-like acyl-CoA dehydrogenase